MVVDWSRAHRVWEKWATKHVAPSEKPVQAALLLNYNPSGPSRLLPFIVPQQRTWLAISELLLMSCQRMRSSQANVTRSQQRQPKPVSNRLALPLVIPGAAKAAGRGRFDSLCILTGQVALKKRVRAFAEGAMIMACPVLLAVALQKVNLKSGGNGGFLLGSISPLAALTLEAGLLPFLCLSLPRLLVAQDLMFRASKVLIHLCTLLLMALACGILLIISTKNLYFTAVILPLVLLTLWRCFVSMHRSHDAAAAVYGGCDEVLERSLDFSASVTSLLFLGLEGLALDGQSSSSGQLLQGEPRLSVSLGVTFIACALGVFAMLLGTVPPLVTDSASGRRTCNVVERLNIVLAVATATVMLLITSVPFGEVAWLLFVPLLLSFVVWMYKALVDYGHQLAGHGAAVAEGEEGEGFWRPASLLFHENILPLCVHLRAPLPELVYSSFDITMF